MLTGNIVADCYLQRLQQRQEDFDQVTSFKLQMRNYAQLLIRAVTGKAVAPARPQ